MQNNFGYGSQLRACGDFGPEVFALATFALGYQLSYFIFIFATLSRELSIQFFLNFASKLMKI
jgi:hypothetical protein